MPLYSVIRKAGQVKAYKYFANAGVDFQGANCESYGRPERSMTIKRAAEAA